MTRVDKRRISSDISRLSFTLMQRCGDGEMKIRNWSLKHSPREPMGCKHILALVCSSYLLQTGFCWDFGHLGFFGSVSRRGWGQWSEDFPKLWEKPTGGF